MMGRGAVVFLLVLLFINTCLVGFGVAGEDTMTFLPILNTNGSETPVELVATGDGFTLEENDTFSTTGASTEGTTGIVAFAGDLLNNAKSFYNLITLLLFGYSSLFVLLGLPPLLIYVLTSAVGIFEIYIIINLLVPVVSAVRGVLGI